MGTHAQRGPVVRLLLEGPRDELPPTPANPSTLRGCGRVTLQGEKVILQEVGTMSQQNLCINANPTSFGPMG